MRNQNNQFSSGDGLSRLEKFAQSVQPLDLNNSHHARSTQHLLSTGKQSVSKLHATSVRGVAAVNKDEFFSSKSEISEILGGSVFQKFQKKGVAGLEKKGEVAKRLEDFTNTQIEDVDQTANQYIQKSTSSKMNISERPRLGSGQGIMRNLNLEL